MGLIWATLGAFAVLLVVAIVVDFNRRRGMGRSFSRGAAGRARGEAFRARRVEAARLDAATGVPPRADGSFGGIGSP